MKEKQQGNNEKATEKHGISEAQSLRIDYGDAMNSIARTLEGLFQELAGLGEGGHVSRLVRLTLSNMVADLRAEAVRVAQGREPHGGALGVFAIDRRGVTGEAGRQDPPETAESESAPENGHTVLRVDVQDMLGNIGDVLEALDEQIFVSDDEDGETVRRHAARYTLRTLLADVREQDRRLSEGEPVDNRTAMFAVRGGAA